MSKISLCIYVAILATLSLWIPSSEAKKCQKFGISIREGKTVPAPVGNCMKITCVNASKNQIGAVACPAFQVRKGCRRSQEDLTKRYPDCCPRPICQG